MQYIKELQLGLHLFSILMDGNKYYCYGKPKKDYKTMKWANKASYRIGINMCINPEKYLNNVKITKADVDEMIMRKHQILYYNPNYTVEALMIFLGNETINDRYTYDTYLRSKHNRKVNQYIKHLHQQYKSKGFKRLKQNQDYLKQFKV